MSEINLIPFYQKGVRVVFPGATLKTDGFMYWVECDKEIISSRMSMPERAWRSAMAFAGAR